VELVPDVTLRTHPPKFVSTAHEFPETPQIMLPNLRPAIFICLAITLLSFVSPVQASNQEDRTNQEIQRILTKLQSNDDNQEREAEGSLVGLGEDAAPPLIEILKTTEDGRVRESVFTALIILGKDAVPALIDHLKVETSRPIGNTLVLRHISNALASIAGQRGDIPALREAVPHLVKIIETGQGKHHAAMEMFKDKNRLLTEKDIDEINVHLQDFDAAAHCLGRIGSAAGSAVPLLIEVLVSEKPRRNGYHKVESIELILDDLITKSDFSANEEIINAFEKNKDELRVRDRKAIEPRINTLENGKNSLWNIIKDSLLGLKDSLLGLPAYIKSYNDSLHRLPAYILFVILSWLAIFLLRPIWLLKIYEVLPIGEARFSGVRGALGVPIHYLLSPVVFRPRVLDAWVKKHLSKASLSFLSKQTVKDHQVYVPVGLFLDHKLVSEFTPQELQGTFERNQSRLLISGVGGAGKTSLACQVAKWAMRVRPDERLCPKHSMIPVLLEHDFVEGGEDALKKEILAQLCDSIDADTPISTALLQALLEKKRVLVLVDGLSEMNEETRNEIVSGITRIPTNAVVFTSRNEETIGELNKTVIKPTTIKGNQLSSFVETYLTSRGRKELFEDEKFFEGCRLLSKIVSDRDITVLLAKLFAEQMVAKQEKAIDEDLPKNIPELMLQSIKVLHAKTPSDTLSLRDVIKSAKVIAWECLKKDYRPLPADYEEVKKSLSDLPNGEKSLIYLKDKLKLIETTSDYEKIRFKIDPLAEYLAGMYLVEENKSNKNKWRKFFDTALSTAGSPENITGFLLAVRDCCMTEEVKNDVPGFVVEELTEITRVDQ
jgi:HEAT repeat protein